MTATGSRKPYDGDQYTPETQQYGGPDPTAPATLEHIEDLNNPYETTHVGDPNASTSNNGAKRVVSLRRTPSPDEYMESRDGNPRFPESHGTTDYPFTQKYGLSSEDEAGLSRGVSTRYQGLEYADPEYGIKGGGPTTKAGPLGKYFNGAKYPIEQRIENKKRGLGIQRYPFVVWIISAVLIGVFIWEMVLNAREQGSPISTKPVFNPMLGPSGSALIYLGARFPPCMKTVQDVPLSLPIGCMNNTENPVTSVCTIGDLCNFGGIPAGQEPNQWFRFIIPIFLHAGVIHLLLNLFAQLSLSAQIEREMGSGGFFVVYFSSGIFGNVLGGNFSLVGVPSVGASGAIFGTLAVTWVDLIAHWKYHYRPVRKLIFMTIELAIGVAVGFIPYVDNFAHLGGFLMGLLVGTIFYPVISVSKRHSAIMWAFRLIAIPIAIVLFVLLVKNFYTSDPYAACSGCRYLSCIPSAANNQCQGTGLTTTSTTGLRRRWSVEL